MVGIMYNVDMTKPILRDRYKGKGRPRNLDYDTPRNRMSWALDDALTKPLIHELINQSQTAFKVGDNL